MVDDGESKGPKRTYESCRGLEKGGAEDSPPPPKKQRKETQEPLDRRVVLAPRKGRSLSLKEMMTAMKRVAQSNVACSPKLVQSFSQQTVNFLDTSQSSYKKGYQ